MQYFANSSAQDMWQPSQILTTTTADDYHSSKLPSFDRLATNAGYPTGTTSRTAFSGQVSLLDHESAYVNIPLTQLSSSLPQDWPGSYESTPLSFVGSSATPVTSKAVSSPASKGRSVPYNLTPSLTSRKSHAHTHVLIQLWQLRLLLFD